MVVTKTEFNFALKEINESYTALIDRLAKLEAKVEELEKAEQPAKKSPGRPKKSEAA